jgi:hypothetical protein
MQKFRPEILILMTALTAASIASAVSYCVGRHTQSDLRFLDPRRSPTTDETIFSCAAEYALRSKELNDVIFVGDSTCADGIDPLAIERLTGLKSYNLGTQGGLGPTGFLVILKGYLENHPKPRLVVLCLSPIAMENGVDTDRARIPDRFIKNYGPEVWGVVSLRESIGYFIRRGMLSMLSAARSGKDPRELPLYGLEHETYWSFRETLRQSRGFYQIPKKSGARRDSPASGPELVTKEWREGVVHICQSCDAAGIPLLIKLSPIADHRMTSRDFGQLESWAKEVESSQSNVHVAHPLLSGYEAALMYDSIHLNAAGVEKFMPLVAKDLRAALKTGGRE